MSRKVEETDFKGKTVERVEADAVNAIRFFFTDGSSIELEVEGVYPSLGMYGITVAQ